MKYIKVLNLRQEDGVYDYKGLDLKKVVPQSQVYPGDENVCYFAFRGDLTDSPDVQEITEQQYLDAKAAAESEKQANDPITQLQQEVADLWYMIMIGGNPA